MNEHTVVDVPGITKLADLDDGLRRLLRAQLERHGFDDIDIAFDAPSRDWSAQLVRPTVNLFLCDVRRSVRPGQSGSDSTRGNGRTYDRPPALRVDCAYAITAWSKAVIDEHRLLSQVLGILYAFPILDGQLGPRLSNGSQRFEVLATVGEQRSEGRSEFWRSVDGLYKPALDYVVTLSVESGQVVERGPDVRSATIRTMRSEGTPRGGLQEFHTLGGVVRDGDGEAVPGAWIASVETGRFVVSDADGRFKLPRMGVGTHTVTVRTSDGRESSGEVAVPGGTLELSV